MIVFRKALLFLLVMLMSASRAGAGVSNVFEGPNVALTLAAETPGIDGEVRAALIVDLAPGWKTYWIDPGDAGIPPTIDLSQSVDLVGAKLAFPAPHRFGDAVETSIGYQAPFAIALTLRETLPGKGGTIHASVMIGVCRDICIPVSAELALDIRALVPQMAPQVAAAFAHLPSASDASAGIVTAALGSDAKTLDVSARLPPSRDPPELFLAGPSGWVFGTSAAPETSGGITRFSVPVIMRPRHAENRMPNIEAVVVAGTRSFGVSALSVAPPP